MSSDARLSYFDGVRPHLLSHRGLSQHRTDLDENSLESFAEALSFGATHIESDVHATKDGIAVLFHDEDLNRVAAINQKISELTLAQLQGIRLRNGTTVPTLEAALKQFPTAKLNLDIKSSGAIAAAAEAINENLAHDRVLVSSFSRQRRLKTLARLSARVAVSASAPEVLMLWLSHKFFGLGFGLVAKHLHALQIPVRQGPILLGSKSFISRARAHNLEVHFWTVNDPDEALSLLALGATGIVSDRVDLIRF